MRVALDVEAPVLCGAIQLTQDRTSADAQRTLLGWVTGIGARSAMLRVVAQVEAAVERRAVARTKTLTNAATTLLAVGAQIAARAAIEGIVLEILTGRAARAQTEALAGARPVRANLGGAALIAARAAVVGIAGRDASSPAMHAARATTDAIATVLAGRARAAARPAVRDVGLQVGTCRATDAEPRCGAAAHSIGARLPGSAGFATFPTVLGALADVDASAVAVDLALRTGAFALAAGKSGVAHFSAFTTVFAIGLLVDAADVVAIVRRGRRRAGTASLGADLTQATRDIALAAVAHVTLQRKTARTIAIVRRRCVGAGTASVLAAASGAAAEPAFAAIVGVSL